MLRRSLERLVDLLRNGGVNYFYALDQFKVGSFFFYFLTFIGSELPQLATSARPVQVAL